MKQLTLYEQILRNLRDSAIPTRIRDSDERTLKRTAMRLAELLQAAKSPLVRQSHQPPVGTYASHSAAKYDD